MIDEPMTTVTDYALASLTGWLGWRLYRAREGQVARAYWVVAFGALAVAPAAGGTYHGFATALTPGVLNLLWRITVLTIGVAGFAMVAGSATACTTGRLRALVLALATVQLLLYSGWMLSHDAFIHVIAETGMTMGAVVTLCGWAAIRRRDVGASWMVTGVAVSVVAAGMQASGVALHRHFNHNDIYHVIQMGAMTLFYRGAIRLRDRRVPAD